MERERFLPLGTVVLLDGADKKIMITGFLPIDMNDEEPVAYDYSACLYPEGIVSSEETLLFNHDQINKIFHLGFEDEEEKTFKKELEKGINEILKSRKDVVETDDQTELLDEKENIFDKLREE